MFVSAPPPALVEVLLSNDVALHVEHFDPPCSPRLVVVGVHGLGLHCGLYRHVAATLNEHGVAVTLFDCRGHGRSGGQRGHVESFSEYLTDLNQVVALVQRRQAGTPVALMGHSLGGLMVLSYALGPYASGALARVVAVAPWLELKVKIPVRRRDAAKVFRRLRPALEIDNFVRTSDLSRDPEVARALDSDSLIHHVMTARGLACVFDEQAQVRLAAAAPRAPTLLMLAGQDQIVSSGAAVTFAGTSVGTVHTRLYPTAGHGFFFEPEWRTVARDLADWLLQETP